MSKERIDQSDGIVSAGTNDDVDPTLAVIPDGADRMPPTGVAAEEARISSLQLSALIDGGSGNRDRITRVLQWLSDADSYKAYDSGLVGKVQGAWREHVASGQTNILDASRLVQHPHKGNPDPAMRPVCMILGAGKCLEVPLVQLAREYRVILVDLVEGDMRYAIGNLPPHLRGFVTYEVRDITDGETVKLVTESQRILENSQNHQKARQKFTRLLNELAPDVIHDLTQGQPVDFLISTCVSNEISHGPLMRFQEEFKRKYRTELKDRDSVERAIRGYERKMSMAHARGLTRFIETTGGVAYYGAELSQHDQYAPDTSHYFVHDANGRGIPSLKDLFALIGAPKINVGEASRWRWDAFPEQGVFFLAESVVLTRGPEDSSSLKASLDLSIEKRWPGDNHDVRNSVKSGGPAVDKGGPTNLAREFPLTGGFEYIGNTLVEMVEPGPVNVLSGKKDNLSSLDQVRFSSLTFQPTSADESTFFSQKVVLIHSKPYRLVCRKFVAGSNFHRFSFELWSMSGERLFQGNAEFKSKEGQVVAATRIDKDLKSKEPEFMTESERELADHMKGMGRQLDGKLLQYIQDHSNASGSSIMHQVNGPGENDLPRDVWLKVFGPLLEEYEHDPTSDTWIKEYKPQPAPAQPNSNIIGGSSLPEDFTLHSASSGGQVDGDFRTQGLPQVGEADNDKPRGPTNSAEGSIIFGGLQYAAQPVPEAVPVTEEIPMQPLFQIVGASQPESAQVGFKIVGAEGESVVQNVSAEKTDAGRVIPTSLFAVTGANPLVKSPLTSLALRVVR